MLTSFFEIRREWINGNICTIPGDYCDLEINLDSKSVRLNLDLRKIYIIGISSSLFFVHKYNPVNFSGFIITKEYTK